MDTRKHKPRAKSDVWLTIIGSSLRLRDQGKAENDIEPGYAKARAYSYKARRTMRAAWLREASRINNRTL